MESSSREVDVEEVEDTWMDSQWINWVVFMEEEEEGEVGVCRD